jgi:hypothetical protein
MVRNKADADLAKWIEAARKSLVASFASGVAKDELAVRAAITLPWSNGQTEGQITKLKLVKRQMYGRAKIDLLQARLIGVPAYRGLHQNCVRAKIGRRLTLYRRPRSTTPDPGHKIHPYLFTGH